MTLIKAFESADIASEDFPEDLRVVGVRARVFSKDSEASMKGRHTWKTAYLSFPTFTECLYASVLYEKTNYETFQHAP